MQDIPTLIVGVCGLKRSGKTEATNAIVEHLAHVHVHATQWARPLKLMAMDLWGLSWAEVEGLNGHDRDAPHPRLGGRSIRDALRGLGMLGRQYDPRTWVDLCIRSLPRSARVVLISGTRFPNEAEACDVTLWVERPGLPAPDDHPSERSLTRADCSDVLLNTGTLAQLHASARRWVDATLDRWDAAHWMTPPRGV